MHMIPLMSRDRLEINLESLTWIFVRLGCTTAPALHRVTPPQYKHKIRQGILGV